MGESYTFTPEKLRELQLKGLEMALYFKKICDENGLLFYFCGGCCIGALRHQGFIPWDDDVDVCMSIEDMLRFEEACRRDLGEEFYYLSRSQNKYNYIFWHRIGL